MAALENVHVIWAAGTIFTAAMVKTPALNVPKLAGLPVMEALASEHVAELSVNSPFAASVIWTCVLVAETGMAIGAAGVAVLAALVEIAAGTAERFVALKLNGPPNDPVVIF